MRRSSLLLVLAMLCGLATVAHADFVTVTDPVPPAARAFGNVTVGATGNATITIRACSGGSLPCNQGGNGTTIESFSGDAGCNEFTIAPASGTLPQLLAADGSSKNYNVTYTPTNRGADTCIFTVNTSGGNGTTVTLTGTGTASQVTVQTPVPPAALVFADQAYNTGAGETKNITIVNSGNVAIDVANITVALSGADSAQYALGALVPGDGTFPIAPMETATIPVTFNPTSTGAKNAATVTISVNNDGGEADKTVTLNGKGTQSVASVPAAVVFASGNVGVARDANLVVMNTGDAPLNISSMTIGVFPNGPDFAFTDHGCTGQSCATPGVINPGQSSTFIMRCTPSVAGWRGASMTIASDDGTTGTRTVLLKCIGSNVSLGTDKVGPPPTATQDIKIGNSKGSAITYSLASSAGAEFLVTCAGGCNNRVLAAGAEDTVQVAFQAAAAGARSANLVLTTGDDADLNNTVVALTGTGTEPTIAVNPSPLAFGDVPVIQVNGATTDLTINNTGTASLVISGMTILNDVTNQFSFATVACPNGQSCNDTITVGAGESTTVTMRCDPNSAGDKTANLRITSDAPTSPTVVPLTCTGTVPDVDVSQLLLAFGDQRVGTTSNPALTFTVSNSAAAHTAPMPYNVTLPNGVFAMTCSPPGCSGTLAAGASITVSVTFSPIATGVQMANITVDTPDDPDEQTTTVMLTGTGTEPAIAVAPSPLAFGDVPVAQVNGATTNLTITNGGSASLAVSSMTITNDAEGVFSFATVACPNGSACNQGFTVATGAAPANQATVTVRCDPTTTGDKTATLNIVSDAPTSPTAVALTCTGTVPDVAVSTNMLAFGDQRLNTTSGPQTFTVSNAAAAHTAPLAYTVTRVGNDFTISCTGAANCTGTLNAGQSITVSVTFTPSALGARAGSITVATPTDPDEPSTVVDLTGTGVQPSVTVVAPSPAPLALGDVDVNATSAPGTITLRNSGTSDLSITAVTLVGADAAQFAIASGGTGPQTLTSANGSNTRSWTVTCTPTSIGAKTATFRVTHDAPAPGTNTDVAVTCTGRGAIFTPSIVAPAKLDFGQVQINTDSVAKTFTLTNTGNKAGRVTMLTSTSNQFVPSTMANLATDIAPGGSITVSVIFHPTTTLVVNAQVCALNTGLTTPVCVDVTGDGQSVGLDVAPNVDFGAVRFDAAPVTSGAVTITNTGESPLRIDSIVSSGAPFSIVVGGLPVTLATNATKTFQVRLTPGPALGTVTKTATVNATFTVSGTMTQAAVDVTARIVAPQVATTMDTLDFGPFDVDDPGTPITRSVTITNTGDAATGAPLSIGVPVLESGGADFALVNPAAVVVQPGMSTTLMVRFDPATAGVKTGRVTMPIDAVTGMTYTVDLTGLAIDQNVVCNPMTISFPATVRRQAGEPVDATVTNLDFATGQGTAAMLAYTATITGADAADFAIATADASGNIAGNGMKRIPVTFTPSVAGSRSAQLVVSYTDGGPRSCMVNLTGDGRLRDVAVTPDEVDFGTIAVGSTVLLSDVASYVRLTSNEPAGATATMVQRVAMTGAGKDAFTVVNGDTAQAIAMGQTLAYDVEFHPDTEGVFQADLEVFFDADPDAQYTVHVTGRAVGVDLHGGGCDSGAGGAGLAFGLALVGLLCVRRRTLRASVVRR